jgi:hypothetical protein
MKGRAARKKKAGTKEALREKRHAWERPKSESQKVMA